MRPLLDLNILYPSAEQGGDLPVSGGGQDFPNGLSAGQQGIQVLVQERVDPELSPSHRHAPQELRQFRLRFRVAAGRADASGHADQLINGRVHHRHGLPHGAVKPRLPAAHGDVLTQGPEGVPLPVPELHAGIRSGGRGGLRRGSFLP